MASLATYFSMGGYAAYVWSAYALTVIVMLGLVLTTWRGLKSRESELKTLQQLIPGRRGRSHQAPDT
jgi:heme exporter protein D